jgi:curli biogenesis system outer membrane secretion channel CsgG
VKTDVFNVVERGKMDQILKEQGFQQTGCTTTECAVEIGKMLNVQQMVTGAIGKIGAMYTIDISMIDVGSGRITQSLTRDYRGEIEGLVGLLQPIANQLAGLKVAEPPPEQTPAGLRRRR